jgi:hypothetical protein
MINQYFMSFCLVLMSVCTTIAGNRESTGPIPPDSDPTPFFKPYAHPNFRRLGLTANAGIGVYTGDLSRPWNARLQHYYLNPYLHLGTEYWLTNYLTWQVAGGYTMLRSRTNPGNWNNRSFVTHMGELYTTLMVQLVPKNHIEKYFIQFTPYALAGFGGTYFQARVSGADPVLDELYNRPPAQAAMIFPLGLGLAYYPNEQLSFRLEATYRITTTDMLDGTSLINDPNPRNDGYFTYGVKIAFQPYKRFHYRHYLKRRGIR